MKEANEKINAQNNFYTRDNRKSKIIKLEDCPIPIRRPSGLVGLENVGATCYMNASLQCFSNIKNLRNYFLNNKPKIKQRKN